MKINYETPRLSNWGTVTELTLGNSGTNFTDDLVCQPGREGAAELSGSGGFCSGTWVEDTA